jgi:hypothetical protein
MHFAEAMENAVATMPGVAALEEIDSAADHAGEFSVEFTDGRIFRVKWAYDQSLSYDPNGACYNPEPHPVVVPDSASTASPVLLSMTTASFVGKDQVRVSVGDTKTTFYGSAYTLKLIEIGGKPLFAWGSSDGGLLTDANGSAYGPRIEHAKDVYDRLLSPDVIERERVRHNRTFPNDFR